jgi:hypothetical protein
MAGPGTCPLRRQRELETMSAAAAGSTKSTTKVDRDVEIAALARHVSKATRAWIGKDKIRGALQVVMAGFGCGVYQVVKGVRVHRLDRRHDHDPLRRNDLVLCGGKAVGGLAV